MIDIAQLPADESEAICLVTKLGLEESESRLNQIYLEGKEKMELLLEGSHPGDVPSGYTVRNYLTESQLREVHLLTTGITICFNQRIGARRKVLERINARRSRYGKPLVK